MNFCNVCGGYVLGYDEIEPVGQDKCSCDVPSLDIDFDGDEIELDIEKLEKMIDENK